MLLLVAIPLAEAECEAIHEAILPLRESPVPVRWIQPRGYQLTMKLLGDVRSERVPAIDAALRRVARGVEPFEVRASGVAAFPTIRRPQVVWMGVDPTPALRCLKQDLEWALAGEGFPRTMTAFQPHIVLGRALGDGRGAGDFRGLDDSAAAVRCEEDFRVASLSLVRGREGKRGIVYSSLCRHDFGPEHPVVREA